jgi:hypothetical protein
MSEQQLRDRGSEETVRRRALHRLDARNGHPARHMAMQRAREFVRNVHAGAAHVEVHVQTMLARIVVLGAVSRPVVVVMVGQAMVVIMVAVMMMAIVNVIHVAVCVDMNK